MSLFRFWSRLFVNDMWNRLTSASATNGNWGETYNLTGKNVTAGSAPPLSISMDIMDLTTNRILCGSYGANGNTQSSAYTWDEEAVRTTCSLKNPASTTRAVGRRSESPSPLQGRICVILVGLWVFLCLGCNSGASARTELTALKEIRTLLIAEDKYHQVHGFYVGLSALGPSGANLIDQNLAAGSAGDYRVWLDLAGSGFVVTASYVGASGPSFFRSFFADETGVIRYELPPNHATKASQPIG